MLSMAAIGSGAGAASYYADDNYYTDGQLTEASLWAGQGAEMLGLSGMVHANVFEAVLAGNLPSPAGPTPGQVTTARTSCSGITDPVTGRASPGHEIEHPMAIVILAGLVSSTLLNMFLMSALYPRCSTFVRLLLDSRRRPSALIRLRPELSQRG